jgi:Ni/Co efflux regulator RcnB
MKPMLRTVALCTLAMTLSGGIAVAQDHHDDQRDDHHAVAQDHHDDQHDNHHYVRHDEWRKGEHIRHEDWDRGERVDYRHYHLQAPPRGYEWREVDGNYVLAAVATGVIASIVVASAAH